MDAEEAVASARDYLDSLGYKNMENTYYILQDNCIVINFAYKEGDYICYPDLIKVRVSLSDGSVQDIDASGYIRNHKDRSVPVPQYDINERKSLVPDNLKILSEGNAVIPSYGKKELFCFEYKCENEDGRHYVVYVGTQSGKQENILILIEDENGTLAI